ncbi:MAG: hypothetical protein V8Q30_02430 [Acutalibacteraceae bacterium]
MELLAVVRKVPLPLRRISRPSYISSSMALRTVMRLTPSWAASSRSAGMA